MTLLSNYNGMRAPKLRCKNYVALAHWAAPAYQAGLFESCETVVLWQTAGPLRRRGPMGDGIKL